VKDEEEARARDEEMKARGMEDAAEDDAVLFNYDPEGDTDAGADAEANHQPHGRSLYNYDEYDDGEDTDDGEQVVTREGTVDRIQLDIYTSHQRITSSDHKPVVSVFTLDYDAVVPELKAKVHAEVARELDRAENEGRPGITIVVDGHVANRRSRTGGPDPSDSDSAVDFGEVKFRVQQVATLTLANTGRVAASFSFVDKPGTVKHGETHMSPWLTTSFSFADHGHAGEDATAGEVTLEPGETVQAILKAHICEVVQAQMLNEGSARLEEVLVLRVIGGRDHFIPVRATWSPTVIGRSIEELVRVPDGGLRFFAKVHAEKENGHFTSISNHLPVRTAAPKELLRLIEALQTLTERALADEQMLDDCKMPTAPGWPFDRTTWNPVDAETRSNHLTRLLDTLDNNEPVLAAFEPEISSMERLEAVSNMLLLFLTSLSDGVITSSLWTRIEQAPLSAFGAANALTTQAEDQAAEDDKEAILEILSSAPHHHISFVFLTATLAKLVLEFSPVSKAALDALRTPETPPILGRRSLSFRRATVAPPAEAIAAVQKREARIRAWATVFGPAICRCNPPTKEKERKTLEDRQRAVLELFLKPREDI
jgi:hypothetical protein